jgi:hypothetical protein
MESCFLGSLWQNKKLASPGENLLNHREIKKLQGGFVVTKTFLVKQIS